MKIMNAVVAGAFRPFRSTVCAALCLLGVGTTHGYSINSSVTFDSLSGLYSYQYVIGDVPTEGRVSYFAVRVNPSPPQTPYLPLDIAMPLWWSIVPTGIQWRFDTGSADNWVGAGEILSGEQGIFSFKTHYAPMASTAEIGISEDSRGCCSSFPLITFNVTAPQYTGGFVEGPASWPVYNYPAGYPLGAGCQEGAACSLVGAIPEPETYAMLLAGLGLLGIVARRRKQSQC